MRTFFTVAAICLSAACAGSTTGVSPSTAKTYSGTYSAQVVESTVSTSLQGGGTFPCTNTYTMSGTLTMTIDQVSGALIGSAEIVGTQKEIAYSAAPTCKAKGDLPTGSSSTLTGTSSDLHFDVQTVAVNGGYTVTTRKSFAGALSGGVVNGTLAFSVAGSGVIDGVSAVTQSYSTTMTVSLH
jgi:hypothetical protein